MTIDLERMRKAFLEPARIGTHYQDCEYSHWRCAMHAMIEEIESLRERRRLREAAGEDGK